MSPILQIIIISLGLATDAFGVSIAGGMRSQTAKITGAIKVGSFFGIFQAIMPALGWLIGESLKAFITAIDHWIAFVLLGAIGLKIIHEALSNPLKEKKDILNTKTLFLLSIATSIDAFIVGITLNLLEIPFLASIIIIGIVTFVLSSLGFLFGKRLGILFGKEVEILGGIALIFIGLQILLKHLFNP